MLYSLAIDPGKHSLACAILADDHLHTAFLIRTTTPKKFTPWQLGLQLKSELHHYAIQRFVCERPQPYDRKSQKGDQVDIHDVSIVVGVACMAVNDHDVYSVPETFLPFPKDWKGQMDKRVTKARVDRELTNSEKQKIQWPIASLRHNVYDAIHLALRTFTKRPV